MNRRFEFRACPSEVPGYVARVEAALPKSLRTDAVRLGLIEALSNAIIHGALGIGSRNGRPLEDYLHLLEERERELGDRRKVWVDVEVDPGDGATIVIEDPGPGFDYGHAAPQPNRGIDLVKRSFDLVWTANRGSRVVMRLGGAQ